MEETAPSASRPSPKGRLKIFFGMSPGVGKTFAMLEAARAKVKEGVDVVAGVIETHGRVETEALLEGLEQLPLKDAAYRGTSLQEFDLDAMIKRAPQIALVDELAHTNVPGSRHPKRYQDVRELLEQGIHVYTSLNVQHLESRADAVEALSGIQVRERVPDTVLEWADEIEIIDLSPEGLRARLAEGKVYLGDKAATAADAFFVGKNLAALREMALRSTAERVNADLVQFLKSDRDVKPLPTGERVMVAVGPSPFSERLLRWTKRYANSLNATWVAVHVEPLEPLESAALDRLNHNLELARNLGAEIVTTSGEDVVETLLQTARREVVTQIVVGRSSHSRWRSLLSRGALTDRLVADSGAIAVHIVPTDEKPAPIRWKSGVSAAGSFREYLIAFASALTLGLISYPFREVMGYWTVALLFLSVTVMGGLFLARGPVLLLAILSALGWNFFFVPPQFTFHIHSGQDVFLFFLLLLIATTMGQLTARLRALNLAERRRERRSFALYRFLESLNQQAQPSQIVEEALKHASTVSGYPVQLILDGEGLDGATRFPGDLELTPKENGVIEWAIQNRSLAGAHTQNLPEVGSLYLPVPGGENGASGVLRVPLDAEFLPLATRDLLLQMANLLGRFIERENLRARIEQTQISEASQRLQKTLLDTVSHELKTPLTVILSAIEQERERSGGIGTGEDHLANAERSARRLLRNVNMLLDMTRFEGGVVHPKSEMVDIEDVVSRLRAELAEDFGTGAERITFELSADLFRSDEGLFSQLLNQLLRNALTHTPADTEIECRIAREPEGIVASVRDRGPGLPGEPETLFEPFSQGPARKSKGLGLGLSIARRICQILGGSMTAMNDPTGGARFTAVIPESETHETP